MAVSEGKRCSRDAELTRGARAAVWAALRETPEIHAAIARRARMSKARLSVFFRTGEIGVVPLARLAAAMGGEVVVVFKPKARRR